MTDNTQPRPSKGSMEIATDIFHRTVIGANHYIKGSATEWDDLIQKFAASLDQAKAEGAESLRDEKKVSHFEGVKDGLKNADQLVQKVKTANCGNPRKCGKACGQCRFHAGFQSCKMKILSAIAAARQALQEEKGERK